MSTEQKPADTTTSKTGDQTAANKQIDTNTKDIEGQQKVDTQAKKYDAPQQPAMHNQNTDERTLLLNKGKGDDKRTSKFVNPSDSLELICDSQLETEITEKDDQGVETKKKVVCKQLQVNSEVQSKVGTGTWLCVLFWCVLTVFGGLIPLFVKQCKDIYHVCPNCKTQLKEPFKYDPCNPDPLQKPQPQK